jgi:hypothetical protein
MGFGTVFVAISLVMIPGVAGAESGDTPARPLLVIRTYNSYRMPKEKLRAAEDSAAVILRDVGIDTRWIDCGRKKREPVGASNRCGEIPAANEMLLRVQAKGSVDRGSSVPMGFTLVSRRPEDYQPVLSTVFADVVAAVARATGVDAGRLLGYAVAHEIGHVLLNSPQHSSGGLMRAVWSKLELREPRTADWTFLSGEAETMRAAIAARASGRP